LSDVTKSEQKLITDERQYKQNRFGFCIPMPEEYVKITNKAAAGMSVPHRAKNKSPNPKRYNPFASASVIVHWAPNVWY
jgi:hypothetical protein